MADPLAFIHIPKTGGISLRAELVRHYRPADVFQGRDWHDLAWAGPVASDMRLFAGHFGLDQVRALGVPGLRLFTVLREPADRLVSHFHYWMRLRFEPGSVRAVEQERLRREGLRGFVEESGGLLRRAIGNWTVRQLGLPACEWHAARGTESLWLESRAAPAETLAAALERLPSIDVVGIHGRFRESLQLLAHVMGWPALRDVPRENARPDSEREPLPDPWRARLEEEERFDGALFRAAGALMAERHAAMVDALAARFGSPGERPDADRIDDWLDLAAASRAAAAARPWVSSGDEGFDAGWHAPEWDPHQGWSRWSSARSASLWLSTGGPGPRLLVLSVLHLPEECGPLAVAVDGVEVPHITRDEAFAGRLVLAPFEARGGAVRVELRVRDLHEPARHGSGDPRRLGVMLRWARVEETAPAA